MTPAVAIEVYRRRLDAADRARNPFRAEEAAEIAFVVCDGGWKRTSGSTVTTSTFAAEVRSVPHPAISSSRLTVSPGIAALPRGGLTALSNSARPLHSVRGGPGLRL